MSNTRMLTLRDTQLLYRNFAGKEMKFNQEGDRNVVVTIDDPELVKDLLADGWNIKESKPSEETDEVIYTMKVKVNFNSSRPPKIVQITGGRQIFLDSVSVANLDFADIIKADMTVVPYEWEFAGKSGTAAYLRTLYVTIEEDPLDAEYAIHEEFEGEEAPF